MILRSVSLRSQGQPPTEAIGHGMQGQGGPTTAAMGLRMQGQSGPKWWHAPMSQWPHHTRLSDSQYKSLLPSCWQDPKHWHGFEWVHCCQCREHFPSGGLPSEWVCRCGLNNMYWRHHEPPPVTEMCKACGSLMAAEGIDWNEWSKQVVGGIRGARGLSHE